MYCNRCHSGDHYAGNCPNPVSPKVQPAAAPAPGEDVLDQGRVAAHPDSKSQKVHGKASDHSDSGDTPVSEQKADTGQVARNQRWREKNREKYNAYMRKYRRNNRAKK